jgi:hypothetical protein
MAFTRGKPKTGGRQKGTPNKANAALKDSILGALAAKGGQKYLERIAEEEPVAFCGLIGKVLPMTVAGDSENPLKTVVSIEWATSNG